MFDEIIGELADRGHTVLVTTHDLAAIEGIADRVGILRDGRLVLDEPMEAVKERFARPLERIFAEVTRVERGRADVSARVATRGLMAIAAREVSERGALLGLAAALAVVPFVAPWVGIGDRPLLGAFLVLGHGGRGGRPHRLVRDRERSRGGADRVLPRATAALVVDLGRQDARRASCSRSPRARSSCCRSRCSASGGSPTADGGWRSWLPGFSP